jgi:DNA polymerase-3 subunit alpha
MGKKIKAEMDAQRQSFIEGAEKNGVKKDKASSIFDQVDKFAGYGFNKSHAAAYALVCYRPPISRPTIRSSSSPRP